VIGSSGDTVVTSTICEIMHGLQGMMMRTIISMTIALG
jgi:hypothetical protein